MPEALFVFLAPPSWDELVRRLVGRGTETEEERERRLDTARDELAAAAGVRRDHRQRRCSAGERRTRIIDASAQRRLAPQRRARPRDDPDRTQRNETHRVRYRRPPPIGITNPPIDDLLTVADSKYALVIYSAKRARQINAYYSQLAGGPARLRRPARRDRGPREADVDRAARDQRGPADLRRRSRPEPSHRSVGDRHARRPRASAGASPPTRPARCCGCSPRTATTSPSSPPRPRCSFVGAPTWAALSGKPVSTDVWTDVHEVPHVRIGQQADLVVVAPATADLLARPPTGWPTTC